MTMKRDELFPSKYLKANDIPPAGIEARRRSHSYWWMR